MKFLILALFFVSTPAMASWEKVISCDGDQLVVDRQPNAKGQFDYQTVFRGAVVQSMLSQGLIEAASLNNQGEVVRVSTSSSGILTEQPRLVFQLTNAYNVAGNEAVIFSDRHGWRGDYVFHACWMKYPQP